MASPEAQRKERTPSLSSVLLGLVRDMNGAWSVAEVPSENREATMNDLSAMLVQAALKQRKSEVVSALDSSRGASLHAVRWIIDSKNWCESLIQQHGPPRAFYPSPPSAQWHAPAPALPTLPRSRLHGSPPAPPATWQSACATAKMVKWQSACASGFLSPPDLVFSLLPVPLPSPLAGTARRTPTWSRRLMAPTWRPTRASRLAMSGRHLGLTARTPAHRTRSTPLSTPG